MNATEAWNKGIRLLYQAINTGAYTYSPPQIRESDGRTAQYLDAAPPNIDCLLSLELICPTLPNGRPTDEGYLGCMTYQQKPTFIRQIVAVDRSINADFLPRLLATEKLFNPIYVEFTKNLWLSEELNMPNPPLLVR